MRNKLILLFFTFLVSVPTLGQLSHQWIETIQFSNFAPALQDSLSEKGLLCLLRDQQGSTWFGTKQGLIYYNGQELITVDDTVSNGTLLRSMVIQTLFEDTKGDIWLGTKNHGAVRFSSVTKDFHQYNLSALFPTKRNVHSVLSYCQGKSRTLWAGTFGGGVFYLDSLKNSFVPFVDSDNVNPTVAASVVMDLHEDKQGLLWGATFGSGLLRFDPHYQTIRQYSIALDSLSISTNDLTAIQESDNGTLWIGTYQKGLIQYNRQTETFNHPIAALSNQHVRDIYLHQGKLWVATQRQGVFCYDIQSKETDQFVHHRNDSHSIGDNQVSAVLVDAFETLWVVGKNSISTALMAGSDFALLSDSTEIRQPVTALTSTKEGDVWFGTADALLYQWNSQNKQLIHHDIDIPIRDQFSSGKIITALEEDNQGGIWVGMSDGTLARWNPFHQKWKIYSITNQPVNFSSNAIESIYQDKQGTLWIGILEKGAYFWNRKANRIESAADRFPTIPTTITPKVYAENDHYLWLGTLKDGLVQLHYATGSIVHYKNYPDNEEINLPSNQITGLSLDNSGHLWVGTFDQGVSRFNTRSGTWNSFTEREGLVSSRITSVLPGPNHEIWISTIKGISCYNTHTRQIRNYASSEFMRGTEFVQYGASVSRGTSYFSTLDGVIRVLTTPKASPNNSPPLFATQLTSSRQSILLSAPRGNVHRIELPYDENAFEITYALQQFPFEAKHQYKYFLEGLDKQWKDVGSRTLATYTNLNPGEYRFRLRAISSQNEVVEAKPLLIIIHPAWYQTVWFKLLVAIIVILLFAALYYYRIASVKRRNRILEEVVAERTQELVSKNQFIEQQHQNIVLQNQQLEEAKATIDQKNDDLVLLNQDLEERVQQRTHELAQTNEALRHSNGELDLFVYRAYHDIIGPIARIEGLCQVAAMEVNGQPVVDGYLNKLLDNCRTARTSLQKVLQIHHVRHHNLQHSLVNIQEFICDIYATTIALFPDQNALQFSLECNSVLHLETDAELLTLILQGFIKNAIQYSIPSPEAYIRVVVNHSDHAGIQILVEDNGEGILPKLQEKLFTMFFRGHESKSGTGLDLYIARLAAERLQTTVKYHPELDHTCFSLTIPLPELRDDEKILSQEITLSKA